MTGVLRLFSKFSPSALWQRLLWVFNMNDPQWGRPPQGGQQGGSGGSGGASGSEPPDDDERKAQDTREDSEDRGAEDGHGDDGRGSRSNPPQDRRSDGPPDLDEIWRDVSGKLGSIFGGRSNDRSQNSRGKASGQQSNGDGWGQNDSQRPSQSGDNGGWGQSHRGSGSRGGMPRLPSVNGKGVGAIVGLVLALAAVGWMMSGLFTVQEGEKAVVLTFGQYTHTVGPGLHWHWPYPVQSRETVATERLRTVDIGNNTINAITGLGNQSMLTQDKNIMDIRFTVQYRVNDIQKYLFENAQTDEAVIFAAESAVREVVGSTPMDVVIKRESCVPRPGRTLLPGDPCTVVSAPAGVEEVKAAVEEPAVSVPEESAPENSLLAGETPETAAGEAPVATGAAAAIDVGSSSRLSLAELMTISIQAQLDKLDAGIDITNVNIQDVQPPDKVRPAFNEARSATAEKESLSNEGKAYANQRVASAEGVVARLTEDSLAYRAVIEAQAQGDAQRFTQIYEQYRLAPQVTRNRMYLEAMQAIYSNVTKVLVDSRNNSMLYLPLDQLMRTGPVASTGASGSAVNPGVAAAATGMTGGGATGGVADNAPSAAGENAVNPSSESRVRTERGDNGLSRSRF